MHTCENQTCICAHLRWLGCLRLVSLELLASLHLHGAVNNPVRSQRLQPLHFHDHHLVSTGTSECCKGEVIHLLRAKESAADEQQKYNPSPWLVTHSYCLHCTIDSGWFSAERVSEKCILSRHYASQTMSLLADIICHIHSYTFSLKAQGLQCSTAFAKSTS